MMRLILLLSVFFTMQLFAATVDRYAFNNREDAERFNNLTKQIRCLVCQNQNLADSDAPLAKDLREKIYKLIQGRKSNNEIKLYLVKRYGDFILLQPPFNNVTFILWIFPFLAGLLSLFLLKRSFDRR